MCSDLDGAVAVRTLCSKVISALPREFHLKNPVDAVFGDLADGYISVRY